MKYQLDITLSDEDYLELNYRTKSVKKAIILLRFLIFLMILPAAVYVLITSDFEPLSIVYSSILVLFAIVYNVFFLKKSYKRTLKRQILKLKKDGKLPYDPAVNVEFHDDKIVEFTNSSRTEFLYDRIERIHVLKDRYIYLYTSAISAYILPIPQLKEQVNQEEFLNFLSQKCPCVEYFKV